MCGRRSKWKFSSDGSNASKRALRVLVCLELIRLRVPTVYFLLNKLTVVRKRKENGVWTRIAQKLIYLRIKSSPSRYSLVKYPLTSEQNTSHLIRKQRTFSLSGRPPLLCRLTAVIVSCVDGSPPHNSQYAKCEMCDVQRPASGHHKSEHIRIYYGMRRAAIWQLSSVVSVETKWPTKMYILQSATLCAIGREVGIECKW